jgi:membrane protein
MANPELSWPFNKIKQWNDAIWHTPLSELSRRKSFFIRQLRIIVLAAQNSLKDRVNLRASALTFYTLISIIPIVAIGLAIAKGFGLDQNLESIIRNTKEFALYGDILDPLLENAKNTVQRTRGGYLAGIGALILIWSVVSLLGQIETSFNHIWQTSVSRPWHRKFTDYLTILLILPIFIILSSSITIFIITNLSEFMDRVPVLTSFKWIVSFLIKSTPYLLTWLMLTLLFMVMPNVKVRFGPALISGIIAGTFLKILQWLYLDLQFNISKLSAIYGGLAAIPLFLIFLETCWIVILLGAELSFANQNVSRYEFESEALNISHYQKRTIILLIMYLIVRSFYLGEKALTSEEISRELKIPVRLSRDILEDLKVTGLVSVIYEHENRERSYQPAIDINKLTVSSVLSRLDKRATQEKYFMKSREYEKVTQILDSFDAMTSGSESNILIRDL